MLNHIVEHGEIDFVVIRIRQCRRNACQRHQRHSSRMESALFHLVCELVENLRHEAFSGGYSKQ